MMSPDRRRGPGRWLLALARAVYGEPVLSALVHPVIADLQHEVAAAERRAGRLLARARGVWAFWTVMLVAPIEARALAAPPRQLSDPGQRGAGLLTALLVVLLASTWPFLEWLTLAIPACGLLLAIALHWWYVRHPATLAEAGVPTRWRAAEINFSCTPVGGNAGGLIAVVGSVVIVLIGVPGVRLFLIGAITSGVLLAAGMRAWHTRSEAASAAPLLPSLHR
jgi:hypothetical protein